MKLRQSGRAGLLTLAVLLLCSGGLRAEEYAVELRVAQFMTTDDETIDLFDRASADNDDRRSGRAAGKKPPELEPLALLGAVEKVSKAKFDVKLALAVSEGKAQPFRLEFGNLYVDGRLALAKTKEGRFEVTLEAINISWGGLEEGIAHVFTTIQIPCVIDEAAAVCVTWLPTSHDSAGRVERTDHSRFVVVRVTKGKVARGESLIPSPRPPTLETPWPYRP